MKDVVTKECQSGQETIFNMKLKRSQFLVKNFTSGKIKVTLGSNDTFSTISSGCFENVFNNVDDRKSGTAEAVDIIKVVAEQTGEVEISSIDF